MSRQGATPVLCTFWSFGPPGAARRGAGAGAGAGRAAARFGGSDVAVAGGGGSAVTTGGGEGAAGGTVMAGGGGAAAAAAAFGSSLLELLNATIRIRRKTAPPAIDARMIFFFLLD